MGKTNNDEGTTYFYNSSGRFNNDIDDSEDYDEDQVAAAGYDPDTYIPCSFADGISKYDFQKIVKSVVKNYERIEEIKIFDAKIYGLVRSHTRKTKWRFILDFSDNGHLTGFYHCCSNNEDSKLAISIGNDIKDIIIKRSVGM